MADKLIDLTPRGILNYMKKIEGAIQRDELVLYSPVCLDKQTVLSNELLEEETRSMLEFVGLTGYAVDVKFQKTEDGVAGNITSANNTYERAVHINVSENILSYGNVVLLFLHMKSAIRFWQSMVFMNKM